MRLPRDRWPLAIPVLLAAIWMAAQPDRAPQKLANLGYARLWDGDAAAAGEAIPLFREALAKDPAFPYRWSDLGTALAEAGRMEQAAYCFRRAVELGPATPQVLQRASNFSFMSGDTDAGLRYGSAVLRVTPNFDEMVFANYWRLGGPLDHVWNAGIGNERRPATAFFRFLVGHGDAASLSTSWAWLEDHGFASDSDARIWAQWLLEHHRPGPAASVWKAYSASDPKSYRETNWLDNPSFDRAWRPGGFEWSVLPFPGIQAARDTRVSHTGHASLRLDFVGADFDGMANPDFHHVSQPVVLVPGRYELGAWVRTSGLTTDEGVGIRIFDPAANSALVATRKVLGTTAWTQIAVAFSVLPPGGQFRVESVRMKSLGFVNRPNGTAWVDDLRLVPRS